MIMEIIQNMTIVKSFR